MAGFETANSEWRIANSEWQEANRMRAARHAVRLLPFAIRYLLFAAAVTAFGIMVGPSAVAQSSSFSATPFRFTHQDGEAIYRNVCAGCHMPDGRGATGAGTYPSLARNAKLEAAGYPILLVVNGHKAMPAFGQAMTDDQIAAVVNYVRSSFGNAYADRVSADDVKAARQ